MLYIVGTPIGNLEDFSLRAAKTILSADIILAEDTRSFQKVLDYAKTFTGNVKNENQKIISYYKDVEFEKLPDVIEWLKEGKNVVLVSEAGMPIISDPGSLLVKTCNKYEIPVKIVPGPSALDSAIALCGLPHHHFHFIGFLPKKETEKNNLLKKLETEASLYKHKMVFVAYESPERLSETMKLLLSLEKPPKVVLCRELTKIYEEVVIDPNPETVYKGEMVLCFQFE